MPTATEALARWTADLDPDASPFPPAEGPPTVKGWHSADLPVPLLAAHLAEAEGFTYRHGHGFARHGAIVPPVVVALAVADLLDTLADDALTEGSEAWARAMGDDWPDRVERMRPILAALSATSAALRRSRAARANLADLLSAYLPATGAPPSADVASAGEWLARFDGAASVPRSDLARLYEAAGSPGAVNRPTLYALAGERWGSPIKSTGVYVFRPATRTPAPTLETL